MLLNYGDERMKVQPVSVVNFRPREKKRNPDPTMEFRVNGVKIGEVK